VSDLVTFSLVAGPSLIPLGLTVVNLSSWPTGQPGRSETSVSVLVPARNEAARIEACLRSIAASDQPLLEIVVYDDQSSDDTAAIVERLRGEIANLRLLRGVPLPAGWVGKPHACERLAEAARGEVLVFVDADVEVTSSGIGRLMSLLDRAEVVTAAPEQRMESFVERLVMPLLVASYTSWLPLRLVIDSRDERLVAANGQLVALSRRDLDDLGGFAAVAHEIVDDVAFCRLAKREGKRVIFADGSRMARCRMYASASALWRGFSKNVYEGLGSPVALAVAVLAHLSAFVVPYAALVASLWFSSLLWPALLGVGANVSLRALLARRFRHPLEGLLLHPVAVLALVAISLNSLRWSLTGRLEWAGRRYAARRRRLLAQEGS
jgi:chlorobactene glucosyltransferase